MLEHVTGLVIYQKKSRSRDSVVEGRYGTSLLQLTCDTTMYAKFCLKRRICYEKTKQKQRMRKTKGGKQDSFDLFTGNCSQAHARSNHLSPFDVVVAVVVVVVEEVDIVVAVDAVGATFIVNFMTPHLGPTSNFFMSFLLLLF